MHLKIEIRSSNHLDNETVDMDGHYDRIRKEQNLREQYITETVPAMVSIAREAMSMIDSWLFPKEPKAAAYQDIAEHAVPSTMKSPTEDNIRDAGMAVYFSTFQPDDASQKAAREFWINMNADSRKVYIDQARAALRAMGIT